jgi:hypothetical protein
MRSFFGFIPNCGCVSAVPVAGPSAGHFEPKFEAELAVSAAGTGVKMASIAVGIPAMGDARRENILSPVNDDPAVRVGFTPAHSAEGAEEVVAPVDSPVKAADRPAASTRPMLLTEKNIRRDSAPEREFNRLMITEIFRSDSLPKKYSLAPLSEQTGIDSKKFDYADILARIKQMDQVCADKAAVTLLMCQTSGAMLMHIDNMFSFSLVADGVTEAWRSFKVNGNYYFMHADDFDVYSDKLFDNDNYTQADAELYLREMVYTHPCAGTVIATAAKPTC